MLAYPAEILARLTQGINYATAQGATGAQLADLNQLLTDVTVDNSGTQGVSGDQSHTETP